MVIEWTRSMNENLMPNTLNGRGTTWIDGEKHNNMAMNSSELVGSDK